MKIKTWKDVGLYYLRLLSVAFIVATSLVSLGVNITWQENEHGISWPVISLQLNKVYADDYIYVGPAASVRASSRDIGTYTMLSLDNPCTANGTITSVNIVAVGACTDVIIGMCYNTSSTNYTTRSIQNIGNLVNGLNSNIPVSLEAKAGDVIMIHGTTGAISRDTSGGSGIMSYTGNGAVEGLNIAYSLVAGQIMSINGTGTGEGAVFIPTIVTNNVTNIHTTNATLNAEITYTGEETPNAEFHWDTIDHGQSDNWTNNIDMGLQSSSFNVTLMGLTNGVTYFVNSSAVNAAGEGWGTSVNFTAGQTHYFVNYLAVDASNEDAYELEGTGEISGNITQIYEDIISSASVGQREWGGIYWDVNIPHSANIVECKINLHAYSGAEDDANIGIYLQNSVAPSPFTNDAFNITSRGRTTDNVSWIADGVSPDNGRHETPGLSSLLQSVVDTGNITSLVAIFRPNCDQLKAFTFLTWDYSDHSSAPQLYIEYIVTEEYEAPEVYSFHIDSTNLEELKSLKTESTHSALWATLAAWGGLHYNDIPPTQSAVSADFKVNAEDIYEHIEKYIFLYLMTDNTSYADAAVTWMMNVTDNWTGWFPSDEADPQHFRSLAAGLSDGYLCFGDYMGSDNKTKLFNNLATYSYPTYVEYNGDGPPITWPSKASAIVEVLGSVSLALGSDSENSTDYLTLALQCVDECITYGGGNDGGWTEGPSYGIISGVFTRLFVFLDALERVNGINMFDDYEGFLSNLPYYFLYLTQANDHDLGRVPIQIEDTSGHQTLFNQFDTALDWLYKSAGQYTNNNTQYMAEQWASNNTTLDYIWKSPTVTANSTTNLPLYKVFDSIGYAVFKAGWGDDDTTIVFKSGHSSGHAQSNQGTYMVYQYGRPLTSGNGYAVSYWEFDALPFNNCISTGYVLGNDGRLYGNGQATEERSDLVDSGGAASVPWGVGGNITSANFTTVYYHIEGDQSDVYTGESVAESVFLDWPAYTSGNLTTWLRHLVYLPGIDTLVVFDYVVSPYEQQVNWMFSNRDVYNEDGTDNPQYLEWNSNLLTSILDGDANVPIERRMEIKMLEPESFNTYSDNTTPANNNQEFRRTLVYPTDNATTQNFLAVESMNDSLSTGSVNATRISQDNLIGTKINDASYTWLVLFSTDNASVSEWLDLGGSYVAADGELYSFSDNTILISFSSGFEVIKLASSESIVPPTVTTLTATDIDYDYANIGGTLDATGGEDAIELGLEWGLVSGVYTDNFTAFAPPFNEGTYVTAIYPSPAGTTWYYRFFARNTAGRTNGTELSFATLSYTAPSVTTGVASLVEETTATLSGEVTDIGGDNVTRGFAWGLITSPFSDNWSEGTYGTGAFNHPITGLSKGRKYVVHATANNTAGSDNGTDANFMTKPDPASAFAATSYNTTWALLGWTNGDGMDLVSVRVLAGATAPSGNTTGTQVYWGNGTSVNATGLSEGTQYTFRIFTYALEDGTWSVADSSVTLTVTTSGAAPTTPATSTDIGTWLLKNLISLAAALGAVIFVLYNIRTPSSWIVAIIATIAVFLIVNALL